MLRVNAELLREQTVAILRGWGMSAEHADITAARLAHADVRGIDSHGVALLLLYAEHQAKDWINFTPDITLLRETPVITLLDGDHGLGHVPSTLAMQSAIEKCRISGLAASAVRHSNHYGAAGAYSLLAAEAGFIGMSFTSVWNSNIVPTFGAEPMFGTNPISVAAPGRNGVFYLDMATSTVAVGKVKLAAMHDKPMPEGWVLNAAGQPQTDAHAALREGIRLTPIGGSRTLGSHKGYGLACMVELLCSMLAGGWYAPTRAARGRREDPRPNIGHFFLVIDPAQFRAPGEFEHDLEDMLGALRQVPPSDAAQPVLVPGDTEAAAMRERLAEGVPLPDPLVQQLCQIATRCGAPVLL